MRPIAVLHFAILFAGAAAAPASAQLGFLGPRGTFSEEAAETYRREAPGVGEALPFETMTAVVEALREGRLSRAVLPVASTVAGFPPESARLLLEAPDPGFRVVAEIVVPVELHLMARPGTAPERIERILSHPNALGEARAFLDERFPGIPREATSSTAAAAERVKSGDGSLAAVASAAAARLYDLEIVDRAIQQDPDNATSFWALARAEDAPAVAEATRLVLLLDAAPGSVTFSALIADLREAGLAVVFVNARPLPGPLYGFRYLVYLAGDRPVSAERLVRATTGRALRLGAF